MNKIGESLIYRWYDGCDLFYNEKETFHIRVSQSQEREYYDIPVDIIISVDEAFFRFNTRDINDNGIISAEEFNKLDNVFKYARLTHTITVQGNPAITYFKIREKECKKDIKFTVMDLKGNTQICNITKGKLQIKFNKAEVKEVFAISRKSFLSLPGFNRKVKDMLVQFDKETCY